METAKNLPLLSAEVEAHEYEYAEMFDQTFFAHKLGRHAVREEFTLLGEVESPFEELRDNLESRVIGQPDAIDAVIRALESSSARHDDDNRPVASLAFLGPTGTGKTETARALAETLAADGATNLVKVDCSMFSAGHEVSALIGSPPGYVGGDIKPVFRSKVIEKPGTVVLFDEIEKAAPQLRDLMLQIMDDGKIRLSKGEETCFRDAIVIITSNLGASDMAREVSGKNLGFNVQNEEPSSEKVDMVAKNSFKKFFRPEFINRLNDMIVFHPLGEEALGEVLDVKLDRLNEMYKKNHHARLTLSKAAKKHLVEVGASEPENGARPLVRALEKEVQATFGRYVSADAIKAGTHVHVYHQDEVANRRTSVTPGSSLVFASRPDKTLLPIPEVTVENTVPKPTAVFTLDAISG